MSSEVRNGKSEIWFKRKTYGWGWTPANAKSWAAVVAYVIAMSLYPALTKQGVADGADQTSSSEFSIGIFLLIATALTAAFIGICYLKGEKPSWQWGDKK